MYLEDKLILRENIINQLVQSGTEEVMVHLLNTFLFKNKDVDFIREKVSPEFIEQRCSAFVFDQA